MPRNNPKDGENSISFLISNIHLSAIWTLSPWAAALQSPPWLFHCILAFHNTTLCKTVRFYKHICSVCICKHRSSVTGSGQITLKHVRLPQSSLTSHPIPELPDAAHGCTRDGSATAWLMSERPATLYLFQEHLLCCEQEYMFLAIKLQGGSNMTGTNCDLFTHK
jgi:hypothetical protein